MSKSKKTEGRETRHMLLVYVQDWEYGQHVERIAAAEPKLKTQFMRVPSFS